ncbi:phosphopantetheine-binding protein [Kitasatospora sp. NPDC056531]|uniref:phosphopantetheine-binding protein n=1 Tax=Kitasatospora sp. NPDC056531 TaxID=3345856 RepID=UPI003674B607
MTAGLSAVDRSRIGATGVSAMAGARALAMFDAALSGHHAVPVAAVLNTSVLQRQAVEGTLNPLLQNLVRRPADPVPTARRAVAPGDRLARLSGGEREAALLELVRAQVAAVLALPDPEEVQLGQSFSDLGFDSLTSVELRNRLITGTGLRLPSTLVFDHPTSAAVVAYLRDRFGADEPAAGNPVAGNTATGSPVTDSLARLETSLSAAVVDDRQAAEISARLKELLRTWQSRSGQAGSGLGDLDALSDEELIGVLDDELGAL